MTDTFIAEVETNDVYFAQWLSILRFLEHFFKQYICFLSIWSETSMISDYLFQPFRYWHALKSNLNGQICDFIGR